MKVAYADPPYLGCGKLYMDDHPDAREWDDLKRHRQLIDELCSQFPDGWAMSASSPSLRQILPWCPKDCRVAAWVKPFAVFKPNVGRAYAWEPVIWRGGRSPSRNEDTVRDWVAASITLRRGLVGAKPPAFCRWLICLMGLQPTDELIDLFPGTGAMGNAWTRYCDEHRMVQRDLVLEES